MTALGAACEAYALAKDVRPERYRVRCDAARRLSVALNQLVRVLADQGDSPAWEEIISSGRAARWRAGAEAIPLDVEASGASYPLEVLIRRTSAMTGLVDGAERVVLAALASAAEGMLAENNAALSQALLECVSDGDPNDTCVVASNGRTARAIAAWLATRGVGVPVLKPRDFLTGRHWDFAVVVGAAEWFPPQMFTCPRSEALTLVHYGHLRDTDKIWGVFERFATVPLTVKLRDPDLGQLSEARDDTATESAAEQSPEPAWQALLAEALPRHPLESEHEERVAARLVVLAAGFGLWLPRDAVTIRGLDLAAAPGERVVNLRTASVVADSVLVVRENGSISGTLATLADASLGARAKLMRERQQEWKRLLRREMTRVGAAALEKTLRRLGSTTANLRHWAGNENIRPQHDHDFALLLRHVGIEEPGPYLADGRELWKAHHRAGARLTAALEEALETADLTQLETEGRQQLQLTGMEITATLTAFRVIAVQQDPYEVPASATRRPFKLRGAQWLE